MICIKTGIKKLPEYCDDCQWYESRPHPHKGWTEICELMSHCMDDDQPEEWIYDGNGRPKACPLVEVEDEKEGEKTVSVIIEDMTMPECCMKCPMNAGYGCGYMGIAMATNDMESGRHEDCPLEEADDGWIPVEDRLPDKYGWYLCTLKDGRVNCYYWNNKGEWLDNGKKLFFELYHVYSKLTGMEVMAKNEGSVYWTDWVIAWMPLPKPWEGGQDGNKRKKDANRN